MPTYEITFSIEVEKIITRPMIQNWAENVMEEFKKNENNSDSSIAVIYIEKILEE